MKKKLLIQCDCARCRVLVAKLLQHNWNSDITKKKISRLDTIIKLEGKA